MTEPACLRPGSANAQFLQAYVCKIFGLEKANAEKERRRMSARRQRPDEGDQGGGDDDDERARNVLRRVAGRGRRRGEEEEESDEYDSDEDVIMTHVELSPEEEAKREAEERQAATELMMDELHLLTVTTPLEAFQKGVKTIHPIIYRCARAFWLGTDGVSQNRAISIALKKAFVYKETVLWGDWDDDTNHNPSEDKEHEEFMRNPYDRRRASRFDGMTDAEIDEEVAEIVRFQQRPETVHALLGAWSEADLIILSDYIRRGAHGFEHTQPSGNVSAIYPAVCRLAFRSIISIIDSEPLPPESEFESGPPPTHFDISINEGMFPSRIKGVLNRFTPYEVIQFGAFLPYSRGNLRYVDKDLDETYGSRAAARIYNMAALDLCFSIPYDEDGVRECLGRVDSNTLEIFMLNVYTFVEDYGFHAPLELSKGLPSGLITKGMKTIAEHKMDMWVDEVWNPSILQLVKLGAGAELNIGWANVTLARAYSGGGDGDGKNMAGVVVDRDVAAEYAGRAFESYPYLEDIARLVLDRYTRTGQTNRAKLLATRIEGPGMYRRNFEQLRDAPSPEVQRHINLLREAAREDEVVRAMREIMRNIPPRVANVPHLIRDVMLERISAFIETDYRMRRNRNLSRALDSLQAQFVDGDNAAFLFERLQWEYSEHNNNTDRVSRFAASLNDRDIVWDMAHFLKLGLDTYAPLLERAFEFRIPIAYIVKARLRHEAGDNQGAIDLLEQALLIDPANGDVERDLEYVRRVSMRI